MLYYSSTAAVWCFFWEEGDYEMIHLTLYVQCMYKVKKKMKGKLK